MKPPARTWNQTTRLARTPLPCCALSSLHCPGQRLPVNLIRGLHKLNSPVQPWSSAGRIPRFVELLAVSILVASPIQALAQCGLMPMCSKPLVCACRNTPQQSCKEMQSAADLFAVDVVLRSPGRETRGRCQQQDGYAQTFESTTITKLQYITDELIVCGEVAYESGHWEQERIRAGASEQSRSEYLNVWRREAGTWYVHRGHFYRAPTP